MSCFHELLAAGLLVKVAAMVVMEVLLCTAVKVNECRLQETQI
jgi:hypothetical protein